jgi:hypothetical protein
MRAKFFGQNVNMFHTLILSACSMVTRRWQAPHWWQVLVLMSTSNTRSCTLLSYYTRNYCPQISCTTALNNYKNWSVLLTNRHAAAPHESRFYSVVTMDLVVTFIYQWVLCKPASDHGLKEWLPVTDDPWWVLVGVLLCSATTAKKWKTSSYMTYSNVQ